MENATKALLIAAAVLIAILVITLGINVFDKAKAQTEKSSDLEEYEIKAINDKFLNYGSSARGNEIKALYKTVMQSNIEAKKNGRATYTAIDGLVDLSTTDRTLPDLSAYMPSVSYTITYQYADDGIIKQINING